jgi:hypothetical protein
VPLDIPKSLLDHVFKIVQGDQNIHVWTVSDAPAVDFEQSINASVRVLNLLASAASSLFGS